MSLPPRADNQRAQSPGGIEGVLVYLLDRTLSAFESSGVADEEEIRRVQVRYSQTVNDGRPGDLIEILARTKGISEEHMGPEVARISHAVASVIAPSPPMIPFAGKLMAPSAFYESYTQLHKLSRALLSPIIYAEDTDAIGTGALNPIASLLLADQIRAAVNRRFGIRPFVTAVRLDYESWSFLTRKHFEL